MAEASQQTPVPSNGWRVARTAGALLATLSGVPYALFVLAAPLSLVTPEVVRDVGLSSTTTLSHAITAATCGVLLGGILAAGAVGRRLPAHLVALAGLVLLSAAALAMRSVHSLAEIALARAVQGAGAGVLLVATLALAARFGRRPGRLLAGAWALSVVAGTAAAPWATYRLPFLPSAGWRTVLAPYPWLLALALAGAAVVVVASLPAEPRHGASTDPDPQAGTGTERADSHANRLGWPLLLPAGIAVAAYLIRPSLYSAGGTVTLYSLLLGTALVVVMLAGSVLARSAGWHWGAAPPVVAVAAAVLTVTGDNAFTAALFDGGGRWPLATAHVLPALGGAALLGGLATVAGAACPEPTHRRLAVGGLVAAAGGALLTLASGVAPTAVGTVVVWVGLGFALGAVLRVTGTAAAGWLGSGFAVVAALASVHQSTLRTAFTASAVPSAGGGDATNFLHQGFVDAQRVWVGISAVLLVLAAAVVTRLAGRSAAPDATPGPDGADGEQDPVATAEDLGEPGPAAGESGRETATERA